MMTYCSTANKNADYPASGILRRNSNLTFSQRVRKKGRKKGLGLSTTMKEEKMKMQIRFAAWDTAGGHVLRLKVGHDETG